MCQASRAPERSGKPARTPMLLCTLCMVIALAVGPAEGRAQVGPAVAGGLAGAAAGTWVTAAVVAARAHTGRFVHHPGQLDWEALPIPLLAASGAVLGAGGAHDLGVGLAWAGTGFLVGTAIGAVVGRAVIEGPNAAWTGALVGSAAGLVAGAIVGAARAERDPPIDVFLARLPIP